MRCGPLGIIYPRFLKERDESGAGNVEVYLTTKGESHWLSLGGSPPQHLKAEWCMNFSRRVAGDSGSCYHVRPRADKILVLSGTSMNQQSKRSKLWPKWRLHPLFIISKAGMSLDAIEKQGMAKAIHTDKADHKGKSLAIFCLLAIPYLWNCCRSRTDRTSLEKLIGAIWQKQEQTLITLACFLSVWTAFVLLTNLQTAFTPARSAELHVFLVM